MRVLRWFGWFLLAFFAVALILVLSIGHFKGPITRAISNATGREIDIDGDLRVVPSLIHPTFRADHVRVANAEWGQYDYLLQADRIEASVSLAGLFIGRVIVPDVRLEGAALALEIDKDGRKNWILRPGEEEKKKESRIFVRHLTLDHGRLLYEDAGREISLAADLDTDAQGVAFNVEGKSRFAIFISTWNHCDASRGSDRCAGGEGEHVDDDERATAPQRANGRLPPLAADVESVLTRERHRRLA